MSIVAATLRRTRELCLERAHQFLGDTDWTALVLEAAAGDKMLAADALELLDAVTPGEDAAKGRRGKALLNEFRRKLEAAGEVGPEDPELRFYRAGLEFHFWALGAVCLAEDNPERRYVGAPYYYLRNRTVTELAAVIGKACVLAQARVTAPKPWLRAAKVDEPVAAPTPPPEPAARSSRFDGFTQDPEEERE